VIGLAAIRLAQGSGRQAGARRCLAVGLCLGLALWTSPVALAFALPATVWVSLRVRSVGAAVGLAAGATAGAVPWLYETAKAHFKTLHPLPGPPESPIDRYLHVFTQVIPGAGGLGESAGARLIGVAAFVILLLGTAVALRHKNRTMLVLGVSGLLAAAVVVAGNVPVDPTQARYATYLIPSLAALIAWGLSRVRLAGVAAVLVVSVWTIGTVWNSTNGLTPVSEPAIGRPITELADHLDRIGRTDIWADYWIAYMLSAATQERIVAGDLSPRREEAYLIRAAEAPKTTVVLYPGRENEQTLSALPGLPRHTRTLVGPFAVWTFDTRVDVGSKLQAAY
jgi:hypothetical protein